MRSKAIKVAILVAMVAAAALATRGGRALVGWTAGQLLAQSEPESLEGSFEGMSSQAVAEQMREIWRMAEAGDAGARMVFPEAWSGEERDQNAADRKLAEIQQSAARGLPWGKVRLAARYRSGVGVEQDLGEARRLFLEAAENGHPKGHLGLAELYFHGEGVPQSYEEALRQFRQAAAGRLAPAWRRLGEMYRDGLGVEASDEEAVKWYLRAVEQGDTEACIALVDLIVESRAGELGAAEVAECLLTAAAWGSARAQWKVGSLFAAGTGSNEGWRAQAIDWFRKAAAQGHEEAVWRVAGHYLEEAAPARSREELSSWPGKLPELDDAGVLNNLAVWLVEHGANWEDIEWAFGRARTLGDPRADLNLGLLYLHGEAVKASHVDAVRHFRTAAAKGLGEAMNEVGVCYATGRGVRQDLAKSIMWYRKAAEAGDANAQFNLAMLYVHGQGVEQDYGEALRWLELAAAEGDPVAEGVRDRVAELVADQLPAASAI